MSFDVLDFLARLMRQPRSATPPTQKAAMPTPPPPKPESVAPSPAIAPPSIDQVIVNAAQRHGLSHALVRAIVQIESSFDPWAARYEPAFFDRYIVGHGHRVYRGCSRDTEERLRATSFGLMQVMGQTARELGFSGGFLTALCDPWTGMDWGCRYLAKQLQRYNGDLASAVAAYNAGSARRQTNGQFRNQDYVDKVRKAGGFA